MIVVAALYKFVDIKNPPALQKKLLSVLKKNNIKGSILLAKEGINGTVSGLHSDINKFTAWLHKDKRFRKIEIKESMHKVHPFYRTKVKIKKEIVSFGQKGIQPSKFVGTYINPRQWNHLISKSDVTLLDTRNEYEVQIGQFKKAKNPHMKSFREFPAYVKKNLDPDKNKKVAMYCTGGIRCEKASAYLLTQGFKQVFHLQGGILKYLESVPKKKSLWKGECFVFDNRVAVNHELKKGSYDVCHACRKPVSKIDKKSKFFEKGVSCPMCYKQTSITKKKGLREREKQMQLAAVRGENHIGASF